MQRFIWVICFVLCLNVTQAKGENLMVSDGKTVKFHYTLTVEGEVADTSEGKEPLEYVHGSQMIIPGLEKQLAGMKEGEEKSVTVSAEEAYGPVDPRAVIEIPKTKLPPDMNPEKGMQVQLQTETGQPVIGMIEEVQENSVIVNFNHPLAGQDLLFEVKIVSIK